MSPRSKPKKPTASAAAKKPAPKRAPSVAPKAKNRAKAGAANKPGKRSSAGTVAAPAEPSTRKQPKVGTKDAAAKSKPEPKKGKAGASSPASGKLAAKESAAREARSREARSKEKEPAPREAKGKSKKDAAPREPAAERGSSKRRAPVRIVDSEAETQLVTDVKFQNRRAIALEDAATELRPVPDVADGEPLRSDIQEIHELGESDLDVALAELGGSEEPGDEENAVAPPTTRDHLKSVVESLVFVSDQAISPLQIGRIVKAKQAEVRTVLEDIAKDYQGRGIELIEVGGGFQFRSAAASAPFVRDLVAQRPVRLTRAQLETLALIAYRQPITRPEIDDVRGVDSGSAIKVLLERDLVKILGRKDEAGRPLLYGTAPEFLAFFGMKSLQDLPTLREFTELSDENRELFQRKMGEIPDLSDPALNPSVTPSGTDPEDFEGEPGETAEVEARGESSEPIADAVDVPEGEPESDEPHIGPEAEEAAGEDSDEDDERAGIEDSSEDDESADDDEDEPEAPGDAAADDEAAHYDESDDELESDEDEDDDEDEEGSAEDDDEDGPEEDDSPEEALSETDDEPHAGAEDEDESEEDSDEDADDADDADDDEDEDDETKSESDEDEEEDDDEDESEEDSDEDDDDESDDDDDDDDEEAEEEEDER